MCLDTKYTEEQKQAYLKRYAKKGWLRVWKVVNCSQTEYSGLIFGHIYKTGLNKAYTNRRLSLLNTDAKPRTYQSGFHCPATRNNASGWIGKRIICYIKNEWVSDIGKQCGKIIVIARKAIFPAYGHTEPYKKDLRAAGIKI